MHSLELPLYLYLGIKAVLVWVSHAPWPTGADWFRWVLFFMTGKVVWAILTKKAPRRYRGNDSQTAAGITSLFEHH